MAQITRRGLKAVSIARALVIGSPLSVENIHELADSFLVRFVAKNFTLNLVISKRENIARANATISGEKE